MGAMQLQGGRFFKLGIIMYVIFIVKLKVFYNNTKYMYWYVITNAENIKEIL